MIKKIFNRQTLLDTVFMILGSVLYAVGVTVFIEPNRISPGGITGIATILHFIFGLPTGIMILIINIPIIIMGWRKFGIKFIAKTLVATVMSSLSIDILGVFLPAYTGDRILAALSGGVLIGAGLAMILLRGATTGGTDILAKLVKVKYAHLSMGRLLMLFDVLIIAASAIVYWNLETALYSILAIFTSSVLIDQLLYGADRGKLIFIVTKTPEQLSDKIFSLIGRGVTEMKVVGGYSQTEHTMLMCAVRRQEVARLHAVINENDPGAFVIVTEAGEIVGEGFKNLNS